MPELLKKLTIQLFIITIAIFSFTKVANAVMCPLGVTVQPGGYIYTLYKVNNPDLTVLLYSYRMEVTSEGQRGNILKKTIQLGRFKHDDSSSTGLVSGSFNVTSDACIEFFLDGKNSMGTSLTRTRPNFNTKPKETFLAYGNSYRHYIFGELKRQANATSGNPQNNQQPTNGSLVGDSNISASNLPETPGNCKASDTDKIKENLESLQSYLQIAATDFNHDSLPVMELIRGIEIFLTTEKTKTDAKALEETIYFFMESTVLSQELKGNPVQRGFAWELECQIYKLLDQLKIIQGTLTQDPTKAQLDDEFGIGNSENGNN